jgi:hypothetical protein
MPPGMDGMEVCRPEEGPGTERIPSSWSPLRGTRRMWWPDWRWGGLYRQASARGSSWPGGRCFGTCTHNIAGSGPAPVVRIQDLEIDRPAPFVKGKEVELTFHGVCVVLSGIAAGLVHAVPDRRCGPRQRLPVTDRSSMCRCRASPQARQSRCLTETVRGWVPFPGCRREMGPGNLREQRCGKRLWQLFGLSPDYSRRCWCNLYAEQYLYRFTWSEPRRR